MVQRNILINDEGIACLSDFGRSRISDKEENTNPGVAYTYRYAPPELLFPGDDGVYSVNRKAADIYSLSMVLLEVKCSTLAICYNTCLPKSHLQIVTGKPPFYWLNSELALAMMVVKGERPPRQRYEQSPPDPLDAIWDCVNSCWHRSPTERPNASQLLSKITEGQVIYTTQDWLT
jgi:hypothetical protein